MKSLADLAGIQRTWPSYTATQTQLYREERTDQHVRRSSSKRTVQGVLYTEYWKEGELKRVP